MRLAVLVAIVFMLGSGLGFIVASMFVSRDGSYPWEDDR